MKKWYLSLGAVIPIGFVLLSPATALANAWDGMENPSTGTGEHGVAAVMWTPDSPDYNDGTMLSGQMDSAWVMVANSNGSNLAQVGWADEPAVKPNRHYFYGWIVNGSYYETDLYYGPSNDTSQPYQVALEGSNWVGRVNGVSVGSSSDNFSATNLEYCTEIADPTTTYFPGRVGDKVEFSQIKYLDPSTSSWAPLGYLQGVQSNSNAGLQSYFSPNNSNSYFYTWDTEHGLGGINRYEKKIAHWNWFNSSLYCWNNRSDIK